VTAWDLVDRVAAAWLVRVTLTSCKDALRQDSCLRQCGPFPVRSEWS